MGCATATTNTYPVGKTDADWEKDEQYCIEQSGKITGFMAANPVALVVNNGANKRYEACLKELGWIK